MVNVEKTSGLQNTGWNWLAKIDRILCQICVPNCIFDNPDGTVSAFELHKHIYIMWERLQKMVY